MKLTVKDESVSKETVLELSLKECGDGSGDIDLSALNKNTGRTFYLLRIKKEGYIDRYPLNCTELSQEFRLTARGLIVADIGADIMYEIKD